MYRTRAPYRDPIRHATTCATEPLRRQPVTTTTNESVSGARGCSRRPTITWAARDGGSFGFQGRNVRGSRVSRDSGATLRVTAADASGFRLMKLRTTRTDGSNSMVVHAPKVRESSGTLRSAARAAWPRSGDDVQAVARSRNDRTMEGRRFISDVGWRRLTDRA